MTTATPITWADPTTANASLSPLFDAAGGVNNVLVKLTVGRPDSAGVCGFKYQMARYTVDGAAADVWLTAEKGPRRLYGVLGYVLAE
ncbi:hypothetical protein [Paraburkholderia graminis]|uniref:hypothetical protein n=1 Tax=Paraburkholderia graminis TaxID=60548 RepID=UPI0038BB2798